MFKCAHFLRGFHFIWGSKKSIWTAILLCGFAEAGWPQEQVVPVQWLGPTGAEKQGYVKRADALPAETERVAVKTEMPRPRRLPGVGAKPGVPTAVEPGAEVEGKNAPPRIYRLTKSGS